MFKKMGIYGGAEANTDKNDWQLMHSTALDSEEKRKLIQKRKEKEIARAYSRMEQLLVNRELLNNKWEKFKDFQPLDFIISPDAYVAKEVRYELEKTNKQINYYMGKGKNDEGQEAEPEEVKNAAEAVFEYMEKLHSSEERLNHYNKKYGMKLTLGHILGWRRNPWD